MTVAAYKSSRPKVFTEEGVKALLFVYAVAQQLLAKSGAFRASVLYRAGADCWTVHNILDVM
jgi:hypothetical protein